MKVTLQNARASLIAILALLLGTKAGAEGTKQLSPNSSNVTALTLIPSRNSGSFLGADEANRVSFYISSPEEYVFYGFRWKEYASSGYISDIDMYYKLYNANHVLIDAGQLPTSDSGYIDSYSRAVAGPKGVDGVTTSGYLPVKLRMGDYGANYTAGEYTIEFYRSNNHGASQLPSNYWATAPYFDITVAKKNGTSFTSIPGRLFCRKWGFAAVNSSLQVTSDANSAPTFYSYSDDQTIVKIGFNNVFHPIAYDLAVNYWGVTKTGTDGNFDVDRRSINSTNSPDIPEGYRLFFNRPDATAYPVKSLTVQPTLANPAVTGCGTDLKINFNMPAPGDARILLDLNGTADYQAGTTDRILEAFDQPAGQGFVLWDGKDGLGNTVQNQAIVKISATYERGRYNIPLYDAEINKYGINVESIAPLASTTLPVYWDDSRLTNVRYQSDDNQNNNTGAGIDNTITGQVSPAHAWNGDGNASMSVPAAAKWYWSNGWTNNEQDGVQYNDFGNVRVINTYGWALQAGSSAKQIAFGCWPVSGNVYHDGNGMTDGKVNSTSTGAIPTTLYANVLSTDVYVDNDGITHTQETVIGVAPVAANGTYTISNVSSGNYTVVISTTAGTVGSHTVPAASLPGTWVNTGEVMGTGAGSDGNPDGRFTFTMTNAAVSNINFGIEQTPVSTAQTVAAQGNPGGNIKVAIPALTGTDPEDGSYTGTATTDTIIINTLPAAGTGTLYYNNTAVYAGQQINNYDPSKLTVDPADGNQTVVFTFTHVDAAGKKSPTPVKLTMDFKVVTVSGNIWDDANSNVIKDGSELLVSGNNSATANTTVAGGANLYVNMMNGNTVIQTVQVASNGTYSFDKAPYNASGLKLQLSTNQGIVNATTPAKALGNNWVSTGQQTGTGNGAAQTTGLGYIDLNTNTGNATGLNFGIERLPSSNDITATGLSNPGGTNRVTVPTLTGTDGEDGNYTGVSKADTIRIVTVPDPNTGKLYYDGVQITTPTTIKNYDPAKLTVDPTDGNQTITFTYAHVDAGSKQDPTPAAVKMEFKVTTVSGNIWDDANGNKSIDNGEKYVSGTTASSANANTTGAALYVNLVNAAGKVIQSVQVGADGAYNLNLVPVSTSGLKLKLATAQGVVDGNPATLTVPANWVLTGQSVNISNPATQTNTAATIDLTTGIAAVTAQNFGLEQLPTPVGTNIASQGNPGGTATLTVPATSFKGNDPDGNAVSIRLTSYPTTVTSFSVGTITYYATAVPTTCPTAACSVFDAVNGLVIPVNANGNPTPAIAIDPIDGSSNPIFTFKTTDNAGRESINSATVNVLVSSICFSLKAMLQGAMISNGNNGLMRDDLRVSPFTGKNYLPKTNPYNTSPYSTKFTSALDGLSPELQTVADSAAMFGNQAQTSNNVVDWVFVELRSKADPTQVISTRSVLVQRDGDFIDVDGSSCIKFPKTPVDDYYVTIRHRNHLGAMTALTVSKEKLTSGATVDFTTFSAADLWDRQDVPGLNYDGLEEATVNGLKALWAGNTNMDAKVKYGGSPSDIDPINSQVRFYPTNVVRDAAYDFAYGYYLGDVDMNSKVKYGGSPNDVDYINTFVRFFQLNTTRDAAYDFKIEQLPRSYQ